MLTGSSLNLVRNWGGNSGLLNLGSLRDNSRLSNGSSRDFNRGGSTLSGNWGSSLGNSSNWRGLYWGGGSWGNSGLGGGSSWDSSGVRGSSLDSLGSLLRLSLSGGSSSFGGNS